MKIKIILINLFLLIGTSTNIHAAEQIQSLLYKISGNGLTEDSYILGTMHTLPFAYYQDSVKGFCHALQQAKHIMTEKIQYVSGDSLEYMKELEVIVKSINERAERRKQVTTMPFECNYTKLFTPIQLELIKKVFRKYLGEGGAMFLRDNLPLYAWERFCASYNLKSVFKSIKGKSMGELCQLDANRIDTKLCHIGRTEKAYTQLDDENTPDIASHKEDSLIYSSFSIREQADVLYQYIKYLSEHPETDPNALIKQQSQTYREQNFQLFSQLVARDRHCFMFHAELLSDELSYKLEKVTKAALRFILEDRNISWIPKIEGTIKKSSTLIAMGYNHLIGDEGVLQLLRDNGYTLEPVR